MTAVTYPLEVQVGRALPALSHQSAAATDLDTRYKNSTVYRLIPKFMVQAGDFVNSDGTGSASVYGGSFLDENFVLSHSSRGTLSMANSGPDTNGCQFLVTFKTCAHLDGRHVVFGQVD
jgi:cyclophilin family peptidyl-prolyl cis-trans isomerase